MKILLFILLLIPYASFAKSDIKFVEQRIVFDGKKRTGKLTIINQGDKAATASLTFKKYVFLPGEATGAMLPYEHEYNEFPYNVDILSWMKVSPRKVYLEPGGKQAFRIFLRKPETLGDGEYRVFAFLDVEEQAEEMGLRKPDSDKIAIGINFNTSYGVPIFIRHGTLVKELKDISDLEIKKLPFKQITSDANHNLTMTFSTENNATLRGVLLLSGIKGKKSFDFGKKPLSVYPDRKEIRLNYNFNITKAISDLDSFKLTVTTRPSDGEKKIFEKIIQNPGYKKEE